MSQPRAEGSRLFRRPGRDPAGDLPLAQARSGHGPGSGAGRIARPGRVADPALRCALLRAQLLASLSR